MRKYKISNDFTLPRKYILGEVDSFKMLVTNKLYENENISSVDITIEDEYDEIRTDDLLLRLDVIQEGFNYISVLFKAGNEEDDSGMKFTIKICINTSLSRVIKINIYFNVK